MSSYRLSKQPTLVPHKPRLKPRAVMPSAHLTISVRRREPTSTNWVSVCATAQQSLQASSIWSSRHSSDRDGHCYGEELWPNLHLLLAKASLAPVAGMLIVPPGMANLPSSGANEIHDASVCPCQARSAAWGLRDIVRHSKTQNL